jgi:hypothetical protein
VIAVYKCIERQRLLFLELKRVDLTAASGAVIAIMKPTRSNRASKLHLRLAKKLVEQLGDLFIGHIDLVNFFASLTR